MIDIPESVRNSINEYKGENLTVEDLFVVSKALEKAILSNKIFNREELALIGNCWNKQLSYCERHIRQKRLESYLKHSPAPKDESK